eukprot:6193372-Pleurochrysis_carterae.AAC.2
MTTDSNLRAARESQASTHAYPRDMRRRTASSLLAQGARREGTSSTRKRKRDRRAADLSAPLVRSAYSNSFLQLS